MLAQKLTLTAASFFTFNEELMGQFPFDQNLQTQTVNAIAQKSCLKNIGDIVTS